MENVSTVLKLPNYCSRVGVVYAILIGNVVVLIVVGHCVLGRAVEDVATPVSKD